MRALVALLSAALLAVTSACSAADDNAHPIEANAIGGCRDVPSLAIQPAAAPTPDRLAGTVCIGPMRDQSQMRGAYVYSPKERIAGTAAAYAAAYPVGIAPTNENDTGLVVKTTSIDAFRADGGQLDPTALYASVSLVGTHAGLWTTK